MKKLTECCALAVIGLASAFSPSASAENVMIDGKSYQMDRLIERQIGPGTTYLRLRLPEIPLNVNMVIADLTNEHVRIENAVANESAKGVEKIVNAASRLSIAGHKAIAGQNANFWAVTSQSPDGKLFSSQTRNASIRNGKMVTECNMASEMAFGGPVTITGLMAVSPEKEVYIDYCLPSMVMRINNGIALYTVSQCNKGVHPDEIGIYNSFYGANRAFQPISSERDDKGFYQLASGGDAVEVILDLVDGEQWMGGRFIDFEVKEVRTDAGTGTLGNHDLAIVGRGNGRVKLANVKVGDKVSLKYAFQFSPSSSPVYPLVETAIGGNLLTMHDGEVSTKCNASDYDSMTYPRSLYGTSPDRKTLYMMVIDKSTDPVYGKSAGMNTAKASQIARHFGCSDMMQCDGGGSAELYVTDRIVNKTTESTPRAVANCLMVFDDAPADSEVSRLVIENPDEVIVLPVNAAFTPDILVYNQYGSLLVVLTDGYTLTCSEGLGTVDGNIFTAASTPVYGTITATYKGKSVTREVSVGGAYSGIGDIVSDSSIGILKATPLRVSAGGTVTIEGESMSMIEVYNTAGQLISRHDLSQAASIGSTGIISTLTAPTIPGLYIITAISPKGRLSTHLIVV